MAEFDDNPGKSTEVSQLKGNAADTRKARSANRKVLGLLAVVCLNLAIQPCAIAMAGDVECTHCPPAADSAMAGHHDHHASAESAGAPCATLVAPCDDPHNATLDQRGGQAKFHGDTSAAPAYELPAIPDVRDASIVATNGPPGDTRASPPLNLIYCVFLK